MMPRKPRDIVQRAMDYKQTFGSEHGKRVLMHILEIGHVFHTSFVRERPEETNFREGERNLALQIMANVETDMERLREMMKERDNQ